MQTLDINECAEFLKVHPTTILELAASGELPGAKIGRAWVFLQDDLIEYLRSKVRQQVAERKQTTHLHRAAARQVEDVTVSLSATRRPRRNPTPHLGATTFLQPGPSP